VSSGDNFSIIFYTIIFWSYLLSNADAIIFIYSFLFQYFGRIAHIWYSFSIHFSCKYILLTSWIEIHLNY